MLSMPTFLALEWLELPRTMRGYEDETCVFPQEACEVIVRLDRETADFSHLLRHQVRIDGRCYRCLLVNRFAHVPPYRVGEHVGLIVVPEAQEPVPAVEL